MGLLSIQTSPHWIIYLKVENYLVSEYLYTKNYDIDYKTFATQIVGISDKNDCKRQVEM